MIYNSYLTRLHYISTIYSTSYNIGFTLLLVLFEINVYEYNYAEYINMPCDTAQRPNDG